MRHCRRRGAAHSFHNRHARPARRHTHETHMHGWWHARVSTKAHASTKKPDSLDPLALVRLGFFRLKHTLYYSRMFWGIHLKFGGWSSQTWRPIDRLSAYLARLCASIFVVLRSKIKEQDWNSDSICLISRIMCACFPPLPSEILETTSLQSDATTTCVCMRSVANTKASLQARASRDVGSETPSKHIAEAPMNEPSMARQMTPTDPRLADLVVVPSTLILQWPGGGGS